MNKNARCGEDPGFKVTYDREAPLAEQAAVDICRARIDEEYTVEQVPATLRDVKTTTASNGKWTVTGTAQGTGSYGVDAAEMVFTCTVWKPIRAPSYVICPGSRRNRLVAVRLSRNPVTAAPLRSRVHPARPPQRSH